MEIIEVIASVVGVTVDSFTGKSTNKKITKFGWVIIFLLVVALFLFTLLNS